MARGDAEIKKKTGEPRRLEERAGDRAIALDALARLAGALGSISSTREAADAVCSALAESFDVPRAALYLRSDDGGALLPIRSTGGENGGEPPAFRSDSGFVRWLADLDGPLHLDEYFSSAGESAADDEDALRAFADAGLSRAIALKHERSLIGMLVHGSPASKDGAVRFEDDLARLFARIASAALTGALREETAAGAERARQRCARERNELSHALSEDLRAALSVATSTVSSLEPGEIDERMLVGLARSALADLAGAVERWTVMHDLEERGGSIALVEARGLVEDALRGMLPELEEKELHVSIDDGSGLRELPLDERRFPVALRAMLEAAVAGAGRGAEISISIRVSPGSSGAGAGSAAGARGAEHLVVAVSVESGAGAAPRIAFAEGDDRDTASCLAPGDRRSINLAIARRLVADLRGTLRDSGDGGGGRTIEARIPIDS